MFRCRTFLLSIPLPLAVKGPQLVKILRAGSAEGVSFLSTLFLVINGTAGVSYAMVKGFPFRYCISGDVVLSYSVL